MASHATNHVAPSNPVNRKAHCQPILKAIHGTARGATVAPTFVPELKMPVARARSFLGNHSATVFTAAGKFPDSPRPSANLAVAKPDTVLTSACPMVARLHIPSAAA